MSGPLLAITLGDPAGVGPEVALKALADPEMRDLARHVIVGPWHVAVAARDRYAPGLELRRVEAGVLTVPEGSLGVFSISEEGPEAFPLGRATAEGGSAAVRAVETAARLALAGEVDAIVTAPLNKEAMRMAGYDYPGHTEILGHLCGARATMLLAAPRLRVVHVSVHCSLRQAIERVKRANVRALIDIADDAMRRLGTPTPRIAVAGLNPHAGESRLFGDEDADEIAPAVEDARAAGLDVTGPLPPDTVFLRASQGEFDIVVGMYHDQGHIAVKMFGLEGGVNVTLGLPIIRTSVDHGTAFDIAGKGVADPESMRQAIRMAVQMAANRADPEADGHARA